MFSRIENADQISFELKVNEKLILRRNIKDYIEISYNGNAINKNQFCDKTYLYNFKKYYYLYLLIKFFFLFVN